MVLKIKFNTSAAFSDISQAFNDILYKLKTTNTQFEIYNFLSLSSLIGVSSMYK